MRRTFNVAVSLTKNDYAEFELRPPINMVSGDHGTNILKFTVYDKGLPVDLSGNIAKITCKTPSDSRQQQDMTISSPKEGKMEVVLDQRFFAEGGTYLAEVQLYDPANLKVRATLPRFTYDVDTSLLEEHRVVANEQFSILQQMVDTVASAEERSVEALDTATRAMNIATQKGDKATEEANRAKNEADRAKNEADRAWAADFAKHVTLDTKTQQKFDFVENKVMQDGLINYHKPSKNFTFNTTKDFSYNFVTSHSKDSGYLFTINQYGLFVHNDIDKGIGYTTGLKKLEEGKPIRYIPNSSWVRKELTKGKCNICLTQKDNVLSLIVNGKVLILDTFITEDTELAVDFIGVVDAGAYHTEVFGGLVYNRALSPQEIQHNFSVLNNTPAIKELHTTDSEGKTSILKLASSEDFVEMSTGRTLREEYMGVLKTMGKDFTSSDGNPVEVNDGIEARVISAEIKGQTVKNILPTENIVVLTGDGMNWRTREIPLSKVALAPKKKYTLYTFVYENTLNYDFEINQMNPTTVLSPRVSIGPKKVGVFVNTLTSINDFTDKQIAIRCTVSQSSETGTIKFRQVLVEGENTNLITSYIPFGLSSTEAIISNNGQQYPIYEPTIQGKTRILKATKGTQNWVEISDSEARDTVTYDYKLDSIAGDLGSVPSISDYIDRARKVKVVNTEQKIYSGLEDWWKSSLELGSYIQFGLDINANAKENTTAISDAIVTPFSYSQSAQQEQVIVSANANKKQLRITILKSKLVSQDVPGFKAWLQANPVTVRYQLATPVEVPLTDEQVKAYDAYKKVISLFKMENEPDKLELKEDGSGVLSVNINNLTLNGSESSWINFVVEPSGLGRMVLSSANAKAYSAIEADIVKCVEYSGSWNNTFECVTVTSTGEIVLYLANVSSAAEFKAKLKISPVTVIYKTATPKTVCIPKELMPTVATNKTNILDVGGAVKPSSFKVTVPVDQIATINAELEAIKAVLNSPSNLLLSAKYVEDEFNKNNKLESEMMN